MQDSHVGTIQVVAKPECANEGASLTAKPTPTWQAREPFGRVGGKWGMALGGGQTQEGHATGTHTHTHTNTTYTTGARAHTHHLHGRKELGWSVGQRCCTLESAADEHLAEGIR